MIIERQEDVTPAVLKELERAPNARFKEIMGPFIRHMHEFVRESKLTEEEFRTAMNYVVALGKASNESHNEAVLIAGSLGISSLVCLLNNSDGQTDTDASLLGQFWRESLIRRYACCQLWGYTTGENESIKLAEPEDASKSIIAGLS